MAKTKKNHYYVLVFTDGGPVYVTSIDNSNRWAHWDKDKKPMEFSKSYAEELVVGLNLNGNLSALVVYPFELDGHPYRYSEFECTFVRKDKEEEK